MRRGEQKRNANATSLGGVRGPENILV
jgi:hypothetical protein